MSILSDINSIPPAFQQPEKDHVNKTITHQTKDVARSIWEAISKTPSYIVGLPFAGLEAIAKLVGKTSLIIPWASYRVAYLGQDTRNKIDYVGSGKWLFESKSHGGHGHDAHSHDDHGGHH